MLCSFVFVGQIFFSFSPLYQLAFSVFNYHSQSLYPFLFSSFYVRSFVNIRLPTRKLHLSHTIFLFLYLSLSIYRTHTHSFSLNLSISLLHCISLSFHLSHTVSIYMSIYLIFTHPFSLYISLVPILYLFRSIYYTLPPAIYLIHSLTLYPPNTVSIHSFSHFVYLSTSLIHIQTFSLSISHTHFVVSNYKTRSVVNLIRTKHSCILFVLNFYKCLNQAGRPLGHCSDKNH